jgi:hypothetical protein
MNADGSPRVTNATDAEPVGIEVRKFGAIPPLSGRASASASPPPSTALVSASSRAAAVASSKQQEVIHDMT